MRGSIRKRGETYQIRVSFKDEYGKRREVSKSGIRTNRIAEKELAALITQIEKGEYFQPENTLFKDYMQKWLKDYAKVNTAPKTYERYEGIVNNFIGPQLGSIELSKLKPLHIQDFYNYCINDLKQSTTTVRQYHAIIHKALSQALKWQIININPADAVEKPKKAKVDFQVLDSGQVEKLLERIKNLSIYIPVLLGVTTGMRRGEICGLKWKDVDLDNGIIYVKKQLQKVDGQLQLLPLKTAGSKRKIILINYTIPILKEYRAKQEEVKTLLGDKYTDNGFVVTQEDGRSYDLDYITKNFLRIMRRISPELNIPVIRFHDLRHTHATLLLKAGVNPKVVSERLGHSSVSMTLNTYSHVLPDMQQEAAEKLNSLFENSSEESDDNNDKKDD